MPELSRFFGIIIASITTTMLRRTFTQNGDDEASIRIDNGEIMEGALGMRTRRLVDEWRILHKPNCLRIGAELRLVSP